MAAAGWTGLQGACGSLAAGILPCSVLGTPSQAAKLLAVVELAAMHSHSRTVAGHDQQAPSLTAGPLLATAGHPSASSGPLDVDARAQGAGRRTAGGPLKVVCRWPCLAVLAHVLQGCAPALPVQMSCMFWYMLCWHTPAWRAGLPCAASARPLAPPSPFCLETFRSSPVAAEPHERGVWSGHPPCGAHRLGRDDGPRHGCVCTPAHARVVQDCGGGS